MTSGTRIAFDTCTVIKLVNEEYDLSSLGIDNEDTAIEIRRTTKIKLPDCIIAATAIALTATLAKNITKEFEKFA